MVKAATHRCHGNQTFTTFVRICNYNYLYIAVNSLKHALKPSLVVHKAG